MTCNERVVLITGAARGIGRGCAGRFLADGARVLLADIDDETGQTLYADDGRLALNYTVAVPDDDSDD